MWTLALSCGTVLVGLFALEMSVLPAQADGHAWADPAAALVSAIGWRWGTLAGFVSGFAVGLLEDCLVSRFIGLRAIGLAVTGCVSGGLRQVMDRDALFAMSFAAAMACVAGDVAVYVCLWLLNLRLNPQFLLRRILPYQAASGAVLVVAGDVLVGLLARQYLWALRKRPRRRMGALG